MDDATANTIRESGEFRLRRLARVRPAGLEKDLEVCELIGAANTNDKSLTDVQIQRFEESLDALIRGDWEEAHQRLHELPAWDRPKDLLLTTILQHNRIPPENWTGVIELPKL